MSESNGAGCGTVAGIATGTATGTGTGGGVLQVPATPLLKKLGYGTGVSVFEMARSPRAGQIRSPWAIKRVARLPLLKVYASRLMVEADILRKISHPNIVGFRDFTKSTDGRSCLAMEKCGKSLGDLIELRREDGLEAYPSRDILKMTLDISKALDYIHTKVFILHADVKSFNILISDNFEISKLCDFGVSLPLGEDGELHKSKSKSDYTGTQCWSAPEVLHTDDPISSKTDIFSFGLTMWEMLSLEAPHCIMDDSCFSIDDSTVTVDDSVMNDSTAFYGTRPSIPDIDASAYQDVLSLFYCATEENPKERPTAAHMTLCVNNILTKAI